MARLLRLPGAEAGIDADAVAAGQVTSICDGDAPRGRSRSVPVSQRWTQRTRLRAIRSRARLNCAAIALVC
jgi:hypothetical protein